MPANINPRGQQRDKPFRDTLRRLIADAGEDRDALMDIAKALVKQARAGDIAAIKEVADRLDGKPAQAIENSGEVNVNINTTDQSRARAMAVFIAKTRAQGEAKTNGSTH